MSTDTSFVTRSHEENWLPVLELAVEEVFEIMLGTRVKPAEKSEHTPNGEFTAMIGLAGSLCGILTVSCDAETAGQIAKSMLGDTAKSAEEVGDALGEICNMIAGYFESGSAQMKSTALAAFDRIADMLRQRDYRLQIEGHTDDAPIHNSEFPSNWELSTSRATEIVRLLIVRDGFSPDRSLLLPRPRPQPRLQPRLRLQLQPRKTRRNRHPLPHSSPRSSGMQVNVYSSNSIQSALSMGIAEYGAISLNPILR